MGRIKLCSFVSDMTLGGDLIILQAIKTYHDSGANLEFRGRNGKKQAVFRRIGMNLGEFLKITFGSAAAGRRPL